MAEIYKIETLVSARAVLTLDEKEICALDALVGYGIDPFLKVFYEKMGRAYLEPHEAGLRSLFETVSGCNGITSAAKECREFMRLAEKDRKEALRRG